MGDIFKGEESKAPVPVGAFPGQLDILKSLTETAQGPAESFLGSAGQPFPGNVSAGINQAQQFGFDSLLGALSSPTASQTGSFQQALQAAQSDVSGGLNDPFQNEFAQALKRNVQREIAEAKSRLASSSSARDQFSGGVRVQGEEDIEARGIGEFTRALLPFAQQLEQNRQTGIGRLFGAAQQESQDPFTRIAQALQFGGQQQATEQGLIDRQIQEFIRQRNEQGQAANTALGGSTFVPQFFQPQFGPSAFSQVAQAAGPIALGIGLSGGLSGLLGGGGGAFGLGSGVVPAGSLGGPGGFANTALNAFL